MTHYLKVHYQLGLVFAFRNCSEGEVAKRFTLGAIKMILLSQVPVAPFRPPFLWHPFPFVWHPLALWHPFVRLSQSRIRASLRRGLLPSTSAEHRALFLVELLHSRLQMQRIEPQQSTAILTRSRAVRPAAGHAAPKARRRGKSRQRRDSSTRQQHETAARDSSTRQQ
jgi:hypothetical protein